MIATTLVQSRHLLELGIDPKTADMSYSEEYFGKDKDGNDEWCWRLNACKFINVEGILPAWSLSALLEVMPNETRLLKAADNGTYLCDIRGFSAAKWYDNPIDEVFFMIVYLLEQGLIEKEGKDD